MRVPDDEVGEGNVKVTLSFAPWKDRNVAEATLEVPVVDMSDKFDKVVSPAAKAGS